MMITLDININTEQSTSFIHAMLLRYY